MYNVLKQQEYYSLAIINRYPLRSLMYVEGEYAKPRFQIQSIYENSVTDEMDRAQNKIVFQIIVVN